MSITDELRGFASNWDWLDRGSGATERKILTIADRIDAEHEKAIRELNNLADACVLLPRDANGEVIHVGDVMERMERCGKVVALQLSDNPWGDGNHWAIQLEGENAPTVLDRFFHHHEATVEDVLREFTDAILEWSVKSGTVAETGTWSDIAAEYAAKLQLKE